MAVAITRASGSRRPRPGAYTSVGSRASSCTARGDCSWWPHGCGPVEVDVVAVVAGMGDAVDVCRHAAYSSCSAAARVPAGAAASAPALGAVAVAAARCGCVGALVPLRARSTTPDGVAVAPWPLAGDAAAEA